MLKSCHHTFLTGSVYHKTYCPREFGIVLFLMLALLFVSRRIDLNNCYSIFKFSHSTSLLMDRVSHQSKTAFFFYVANVRCVDSWLFYARFCRALLLKNGSVVYEFRSTKPWCCSFVLSSFSLFDDKQKKPICASCLCAVSSVDFLSYAWWETHKKSWNWYLKN